MFSKYSLSLKSSSPLTSVRDADGSYNTYPFGDPFVKNPYLNESDEVYKDKTEEWKIFFRIFAEINLAKNFTYNTNFAYNPAFSSRGYYYDERSVSYQDCTCPWGKSPIKSSLVSKIPGV